MKKEVVIVGAGPSGLAIAACLNMLSIPNIILEKENCSAFLWRMRTYDRLKLHLAKQFCELPHMPYPSTFPTFIPKNEFIQYLDNYQAHFKQNIVYCTMVESASYDKYNESWCIMAYNNVTGEVKEYISKFLVVATGENGEEMIPDIPGLKTFSGEVIHSSFYKSGVAYMGKNVLVVGSGNSGMEIAYDLSNFGAKTSITIRNPFHIMTKELIYMGMVLANYLHVGLVDTLLLIFSYLIYGNLSKYGITRPELGPLSLKIANGTSAVIDVGTIAKIKTKEIQVVQGLSSIEGNEIIFTDGKSYQFDIIVFATGYRSTIKKWLQDDFGLLNKDGFPMANFPNQWKGKNGLYFVGFARRGLAGISMDAKNVANDIKMAYDYC